MPSSLWWPGMQAAAELYEVGGRPGRAAALFLAAGDLDRGAAILAAGDHPELQLPLARGMEGVLSTVCTEQMCPTQALHAAK